MKSVPNCFIRSLSGIVMEVLIEVMMIMMITEFTTANIY